MTGFIRVRFTTENKLKNTLLDTLTFSEIHRSKPDTEPCRLRSISWSNWTNKQNELSLKVHVFLMINPNKISCFFYFPGNIFNLHFIRFSLDSHSENESFHFYHTKWFQAFVPLKGQYTALPALVHQGHYKIISWLSLIFLWTEATGILNKNVLFFFEWPSFTCTDKCSLCWLDWLKLDVKDKKADGYTYNNDKTQVKIILDCKNELWQEFIFGYPGNVNKKGESNVAPTRVFHSRIHETKK